MNAGGKSRIGVWVDGDRKEWLPSSVKTVSNIEIDPDKYPEKIGNDNGTRISSALPR